MIKKGECIPEILKILPNFQEKWDEHVDWWEGESAGLCNDMSEVSNFLCENIDSLSDSTLVKLFETIEKFLVDGDKEVATAAATCFLENLQNAECDTRFVKFLGPESKAYCKAWDEFTKVKTPGLWDE